MNRGDGVLWGVIFGTVVALVLVLALASTTGVNFNPGSGEKVGTIVKISQEGLACKTWEAQLIRGGMSNGSGSFGTQPFDFTVEDDAAAEVVRQFMEQGAEVRIHYRMEAAWMSCNSSSGGHFLTSIEPMQP